MKRILLTDVDNTLFSWIDYFAPCFRALVHAVSRASQIAEDELYDGFQMVFQREGSVEYRRALQENRMLAGLPLEERERLVHVGHVAFGQTMRSHLRPYSDVIETLKALRADGVSIVAVTNSGALQALHRIRSLGLAKLLDGLVAWDHDVASMAEDDGDYTSKVQLRSARSGLPWVTTLGLDALKPNAESYKTALRRLVGRGHASVWVIGDSLQKDLAAAQELGATSVWARYGHKVDEKNFATVVRITHWSPDKIRAAYDTDSLVPNFAIDSFKELLSIIPIHQGELF